MNLYCLAGRETALTTAGCQLFQLATELFLMKEKIIGLFDQQHERFKKVYVFAGIV